MVEFELCELFHLILDDQTERLIAITFDGNKNESCECYLGNKEQKTMFLVAS